MPWPVKLTLGNVSDISDSDSDITDDEAIGREIFLTNIFFK